MIARTPSVLLLAAANGGIPALLVVSLALYGGFAFYARNGPAGPFLGLARFMLPVTSMATLFVIEDRFGSDSPYSRFLFLGLAILIGVAYYAVYRHRITRDSPSPGSTKSGG